MRPSIHPQPVFGARPLAAAPQGARAVLAALALGLLAGCVTVNVYFPAAEAQRAADKIINAVTGSTTPAPGSPAQPSKPQVTAPATQPPSSSASAYSHAERLLASTAAVMLDSLIPAARAADRANLNISTPQIRAIIADMHQRFQSLKPYFVSGVVGVTANGTIAVRDQSTVPLMKRAALAQLVAQQNQDLAQLYTEIAEANGHPEWATDIRSAFAQRWIAHARQTGWYYRDGNGNWVKG